MGRRKKPAKGAGTVEPEIDTTSFSMGVGSAPPAIVGDDFEAFPPPCTFGAATAAASGGALGFVFGFGQTMLTHSKGGGMKGRLKAARGEGISSAKSFAIATSIYAMTSCVAQRLRQQNDAWNGAVGGAVSGLALGWSGGPVSALSSALMAGVVSYVVWANDANAAQPCQGHPNQVAARAGRAQTTFPPCRGRCQIRRPGLNARHHQIQKFDQRPPSTRLQGSSCLSCSYDPIVGALAAPWKTLLLHWSGFDSHAAMQAFV